jgi:Flp pilus assembly protein TadD
MTAPPSAGTRSRPEFLILFVLAASGLAIYAQTLSYGFITFDDPGYVYENKHVTGGLTWAGVCWAFTSLEQSNWHPLTWLSLLADAQLYGLHAGGYHLTNLLLHLANAALLFFWLRSATGAVWPSALTAFFFVAHPLHVESVAWVTERKDVLSTFFFCLTLCAYTRYAQRGGAENYAAALAFYILGLLAKPMLVSLPVLLCLLDFWPLRRWADVFRDRRRFWMACAEKAPFFLLAASSAVVTMLVQHHGEAVVPLAAEPVSYRVGAAFLGYATYLAKTFYPVYLGIYYPFWRGQSYVLSMLWGAGLVAVLAGTVLLWRRMPWLVVGWCWFVGTLVPVIGLVQVGGQAMADRYTYLPHIGLFMMIFWTAADVWQRHPGTRAPLAALAGFTAVACLGLSIRQVYYWRSSAALFEHTLQVAEPSGRLYHLLGDALMNENRLDAAGVAYRKSFRLQPGDKDVELQLGVIDLKEQRWSEAQEAFARLAAGPEPDARVFNDDALALAHLGRTDEAKRMYQRALEKDANYALAHFGLADLLSGCGETAAAADEYERGLTLRDDWIPALSRLAWIDAQRSDAQSHAAAVFLARRAVELTHGEDLASLDALAAAEASEGHWESAMVVAEAALKVAGGPGAPPGADAICRERLELYRGNRMPLR